MKNNDEGGDSKIKLLLRQLFGWFSSQEANQQESIAKSKKEAEAKAKREAEANMAKEAAAKAKKEVEILKFKQANQQHSNPDQGDILKILDKLNDLSDEFKILRNEIEEKDKEIQRYKEGYEARKVKDFFSKFTLLDSVIKEYLDENKIDIEGLKDIQIQMDEAFAEYGIETFSPEIGTEIQKVTGLVEENFKKIVTNNKIEHLTVAEVLKVGYRRKLPDSKFEIISKSKVRIFVFED